MVLKKVVDVKVITFFSIAEKMKIAALQGTFCSVSQYRVVKSYAILPIGLH